MARTREEIKAAIIAYKDGSATLSELDSPSMASIYLLTIDMVSFAIWAVEKIWDIFKLEVEELERTSYVHTSDWYAQKMLEYQHGDDVIVDTVTKQPSYAVIDASKRVISQVAVVGAGIALIKCAKDSGGFLQPLSGAELTGALSYLRDIQTPGIQIGLISITADLLKVGGEVIYEGTLIDAQTAVETAINDFLKNINMLNFNGELKRSDLVNAVRAVDRVEDFYLTLFEGTRDGGAYEVIARSYYPFAGYSMIDPIFPLSSTLTFTAL